MNADADHARARAGRLWQQRRRFEIEAGERFRRLSQELAAQGASEPVVTLAREAAADELRHAELCAGLAAHFGQAVAGSPTANVHRVAPARLAEQDRLLYEIVALSCVTETLSTALLGVLVERAEDSLAKQAMRSILRDEVKHSKLGWAFLAERHRQGARDCVGEHLAPMLDATLGHELFFPPPAQDPSDELLATLGALEHAERRRIAGETLELVVFPGLERFGVDTARGKRWLRERLRAVRTTG